MKSTKHKQIIKEKRRVYNFAKKYTSKHTTNIIMPVGCLGNSSSTDQKDLRNHSISGSHLDEGGGNGNTNQVKH